MCLDAVDAVASVAAVDVACMANFDYELFRFTYLPVLLPTTAAIDVFILCWWIYEHNNGECKVHIKYVHQKTEREQANERAES